MACLPLSAPAGEAVSAWGNHQPGHNLEGPGQEFVLRLSVEVKAFAGLELKVHRSHEVAPGFVGPLEIVNPREVVLEEPLPYPAERAFLGRPGLVRTSSLVPAGAPAGGQEQR